VSEGVREGVGEECGGAGGAVLKELEGHDVRE
jgi:hypothetical protein